MLDVCSLDHELTLLQQGCDLTGGNYLKIPQQSGQPPLAGLLQYLLVDDNIIEAYISLIGLRSLIQLTFMF